MVRDLESVVKTMPGEVLFTLLPALKVLVDSGALAALARANVNHLVDERTDSEVDEAQLAEEVREVRQTNRILLALEASARQLTKGIES